MSFIFLLLFYSDLRKAFDGDTKLRGMHTAGMSVEPWTRPFRAVIYGRKEENENKTFLQNKQDKAILKQIGDTSQNKIVVSSVGCHKIWPKQWSDVTKSGQNNGMTSQNLY